ncbi:MAG: hypothetical protein IT314_12820 [Anaerolineales bacterium]|nr:hypothetical protein [Anaerolineales bacterium]
MKVKYLLYLQAFNMAIGIPFLVFAPAMMAAQYGITDFSAEFLLMFQNNGGYALLMGLVSWIAARMEDSPARRSIVLAFFLQNALQTAIFALGAMNGSAMANSFLYIHGFFALAFGYFAFIKRGV